MDNDDLNLDKQDLPRCAEDLPPMPHWFDLALSYVGDVVFFVFCLLVIVGFFLFVGFGLTYWLSHVQWLP